MPGPVPGPVPGLSISRPLPCRPSLAHPRLPQGAPCCPNSTWCCLFLKCSSPRCQPLTSSKLSSVTSSDSPDPLPKVTPRALSPALLSFCTELFLLRQLWLLIYLLPIRLTGMRAPQGAGTVTKTEPGTEEVRSHPFFHYHLLKELFQTLFP